MMSVPVDFNALPFSGQLIAWGHSPQGWWGLVRYQQDVRSIQLKVDRIECAAWMPATRIRRPHWSGSSTQGIVHLDLDADPDRWPAPPASEFSDWFAGTWEAGEMPLPPGVEPVLRSPNGTYRTARKNTQ